MQTSNCETCKYFEKRNSTAGLCRRHCPTIDLIASGKAGHWPNAGHWPMVNLTDWCGEHQPDQRGPGRWKCKQCGMSRRRGECRSCGNTTPLTDEPRVSGVTR